LQSMGHLPNQTTPGDTARRRSVAERFEMGPGWMSTGDLARQLGCATRTVQRWCQVEPFRLKGVLPVTVNGGHFFRRSEVMDYLATLALDR